MPDCPQCEKDIGLDDFDVDRGDTLSCPECGTMLEVVGLSPVELDLLQDDGEDDDDRSRSSG